MCSQTTQFLAASIALVAAIVDTASAAAGNKLNGTPRPSKACEQDIVSIPIGVSGNGEGLGNLIAVVTLPEEAVAAVVETSFAVVGDDGGGHHGDKGGKSEDLHGDSLVFGKRLLWKAKFQAVLL